MKDAMSKIYRKNVNHNNTLIPKMMQKKVKSCQNPAHHPHQAIPQGGEHELDPCCTQVILLSPLGTQVWHM